MNNDLTPWTRIGGDYPPEPVVLKINNQSVKSYRNTSQRFYVCVTDLNVALGYSPKTRGGCLPLVSSKNRILFSDLIINDLEIVMDSLKNPENFRLLSEPYDRIENNPILNRALKGGYKNQDGSVKTNREELKDYISFQQEFGSRGNSTFITESGMYQAIMRSNKASHLMRERLADKLEKLSHEEYIKTLPDKHDRERMRILIPKIQRYDRFPMDLVQGVGEIEADNKEFDSIAMRMDISLVELMTEIEETEEEFKRLR